MRITNKFLASLLTRAGHEVKAELVVDDANGTSLTFPDISEISEIAQGVSISAPDGTYTIADGDAALIVVVMGGLVESVSTDEPAAEAEATAEVETVATEEISAELAETLTVLVDEIVAVKALNVSITAELKSLKASLKHDTSEGKKDPEANQNKSKFKIID